MFGLILILWYKCTAIRKRGCYTIF